MVNPGHRSRACDYCRSVKVKCDEGRPACRRCAKRGQACQYSANEVFRSMNSWSETNVQQRVATEQLKRLQDQGPARQIPLDWIEASIGPFFDQFVVYPDALFTTWGSFTGLPRLYGTPSSPECLDQAIRACALMNMANTSKILHLDLAAGESYRRALVALRQTLSSPNFARDEALVTIMLLITYEPARELFHAHFRGQAALLRAKLSGPDTCSGSPHRGIVAHTNRMLLWRDLAERKRCTLGLPTWPVDAHRSWLDETTTRITALVTDICGRVRELQEGIGDPEAWHASLAECVDEIMKADLSIQNCFENCPPENLSQTLTPDWLEEPAIPAHVPAVALSNLQCQIAEFRIAPNQITPDDNDDDDDDGEAEEEQDSSPSPAREQPPQNPQPGAKYSPRTDIYPSPAVCQLWNFIRCAQLHLYRAMIDLRILTDGRLPAYFPSEPELRSRLSEVIHDMLSSVHYLMGDIRAADGSRIRVNTGYQVSMLFTLHKVCAVPGVSLRVKRWVLGVFERIGTDGHLRAGLNMNRLYSQRIPKIPG